MSGRTAALLVLCGLLPILGGPSCLGEGIDPSTPTIVFEIEPARELRVGDQRVVKVLIDAKGHTLQAYELSVRATVETAAIFSAYPMAEFDDDGRFFKTPYYRLFDGEINDIVDVKHGATLPGGAVHVAGFLVKAHSVGQATLSFADVMLADEKGEALPVVPLSHSFFVVP